MVIVKIASVSPGPVLGKPFCDVCVGDVVWVVEPVVVGACTVPVLGVLVEVVPLEVVELELPVELGVLLLEVFELELLLDPFEVVEEPFEVFVFGELFVWVVATVLPLSWFRALR